MYTSDERILMLIDMLKAFKVIRFDTEFCEAIGLLKQNLYRIRQGKTHFTPEHIEQIILKYKVNANWIFNISDKIFLGDKFNPHAEAKAASKQPDRV